MRMIERGEVDRQGVSGVARALHISERHLHRLLTEEVGAGPLALARAQRANLARTLLQTSDLPITDVAFAAGFSSIRQFNDTVRAVYDQTPTELRRRSRPQTQPAPAGSTSEVSLKLWLAARWPIDLDWMFGFLRGHGIPGVTSVAHDTKGRPDELVPRHFERSLSLPNGSGRVTVTADKEVDPERPGLWAHFVLENIADLADAVSTVRAMFDLDADPQLIAERLKADPALGPLAAERPGVGVPGSAGVFEAAVCAVVGQQISVAGARTLLGRIAETCNARTSSGRLLFPTAEKLAETDLADVGLTARRVATLQALADAVAGDRLRLTVGVDRYEVRAKLLELPGIGPWTCDVIQMRALRDPDVLLSTDLVIRRRLDELGIAETSSWSPWRSYVACTLWATRDSPLAAAPTSPGPKQKGKGK